MIIGQVGTGKSTLINSLLKLKGRERAPEGYGRICTMKDTQIYKSKEVPYLRLIDTRGIELNEKFDVFAVGLRACEFIKNQLIQNNINDFVHCIWYCVSSYKFQSEEKRLINKLLEIID